MYLLYHHPLCPISRQIRVLLKEHNIAFTLIKEDYWLENGKIAQYSRLATTPLLEVNGVYLDNYYSIIEFLQEIANKNFFMPTEAINKAIIRGNIYWLNEEFNKYVTQVLLEEKMIRLLTRVGEPRSVRIREAKAYLNGYMEHLAEIVSDKGYVAYDKLSYADLIAAAHISVIDYFGEIKWANWEPLKQWYSVIKSRPSFQPLLADSIPGFPPPQHYSQLDFE